MAYNLVMIEVGIDDSACPLVSALEMFPHELIAIFSPPGRARVPLDPFLIRDSDVPPGRPVMRYHLTALILALTILATVLAGGTLGGMFLERRYIHEVTPRNWRQKNIGIALQKAAFAESDLLPLYGTSELERPTLNKATDFFATYPTGFNVFAVGRGGAGPLIMFQDFGALGQVMRGRKIVISLSPTWFLKKDVPHPRHYYGNFSILHAGECIYDADLSLDLRHQAASAMLRYEHTPKKSAILSFALRKLADDSTYDRALFLASVPPGVLENWIRRVQDHFAALTYILKERSRLNCPDQQPRLVEWENEIARTATMTVDDSDEDPEPIGVERGAPWFFYGQQRVVEWANLELLLRELVELGARPLLLSMPINGRYCDQFGVTRKFRNLYYKRVRALAKKYHLPLMSFEEHDEDAAFLADHHDHLSARGWLYYDKAIDDFFHDRLMVGEYR